MTADIAKVHDIQWYSEVPRSIWKQTVFGLLLVFGVLRNLPFYPFNVLYP